MEEVVAVKIVDSNGQQHFFITWGRVFDAIDAESLLKAVTRAVGQFGITGIRDAEVCETLQAAASELYFYEGLLNFFSRKIPKGKAYTKWKSARRRRIEAGKEIYYLGSRDRN